VQLRGALNQERGIGKLDFTPNLVMKGHEFHVAVAALPGYIAVLERVDAMKGED
jgi:hypothetical protein